MIILTPEQLQAMKPEATPARVLNPQTHETFVLVPLEAYKRLTGDAEYDDSPWTDEEMNLLRRDSCAMLDSFGSDA